MISYTEAGLLESLRFLPKWQRALFAANCAERQFPLYELFGERSGRGDAATVRSALDPLWRWASEREGGDNPEIANRVTACRDKVPRLEDYSGALVDFAQDAVASVIYGLQALQTDDPQFAAWAARLAYQAVDAAVAIRGGVDFNLPGTEAAVLSSQLVQTELLRQIADLELLRKLASLSDAGMVEIEEMRAQSSLAGTGLKALVANLT